MNLDFLNIQREILMLVVEEHKVKDLNHRSQKLFQKELLLKPKLRGMV
jgi:hypothetical protein